MQAPTYSYAPWYPPTLASERDREGTVELLRGHWLEGRLTVEDLELRSWEAMNARYVSDLWWAVRELPVPVAAAARPVAKPEAQSGSAVTAVVFGAIGLALFCFTVGLFAFLSLPFSATGWIVGRSARRASATAGNRGLARTGEVLGIVGTVAACLALGACAAMLG